MVSATKFQERSYEQDPRVVAVDAYTTSHLLSASKNKYHDALEKAYQNSVAKGLPEISCYPSQGQYMAMQVRIAGAKNILEIGTLGGYSSIWFATAGDDVRVTTVEVNAKHKAVAEENIANAGLSDRIQVIHGPGLQVLPRLIDEVKAGTRESFDFVFIDADKANNLAYFNLAVEMAKPGTGFYIDNVVWSGKTVDEKCIAAGDPHVLGAREVIEGIGKDPRVEGVVLQTVSEKNYDGFLLAVLK